jgi:hypothetical protein
MSERQITLETFRWKEDSRDKDANFKREVALYTLNDPMPTIETMSRNLNISIGAIVKYILVRWATSGSDALSEMGPIVIRQMADIVEKASQGGKDEDRLAAYNRLAAIVSWLQVPITDPDWQPGGV